MENPNYSMTPQKVIGQRHWKLVIVAVEWIWMRKTFDCTSCFMVVLMYSASACRQTNIQTLPNMFCFAATWSTMKLEGLQELSISHQYTCRSTRCLTLFEGPVDRVAWPSEGNTKAFYKVLAWRNNQKFNNYVTDILARCIRWPVDLERSLAPCLLQSRCHLKLSVALAFRVRYPTQNMTGFYFKLSAVMSLYG